MPKIGLNFYAKAELELLPQDVAVQISQPQTGSTLDGRDPITLNARAEGDPQLRLLAGIDFTLRDGSVEEGSCPLDTETAGQEQQFLSRSTFLERALLKCPPDKTNDPNKARIALGNFRTTPFCVGGMGFRVTQGRMVHILERHHLNYFNTEVSPIQSYFRDGTSILDIINIINGVLLYNSSLIKSTKNQTDLPNPLIGKVDGLEYQLYLFSDNYSQTRPLFQLFFQQLAKPEYVQCTNKKAKREVILHEYSS